MTRKSTSALRQQLAAQEQADDQLANKFQKLMGWIDKTERALNERDDAIKAQLDQDRMSFLGDLAVMKAELAASIAELRGTPVQIESGDVKQLQAAE